MRFVGFSVFISVFTLAVLAPSGAFAQNAAAGSVGLLNGRAQDTGLNTPAHALAKDDLVYGGDIIETRSSSYALIRFTDQGTVLLRPNSKFQIEKYQYAAAPLAAAPAAPAPLAPLQAASAATAPDSTFFRLLKGGLRAVSGLVAHADYSHYLMSTPVATMGIRGTDYEIAACEDSCLTDSTVTQAVPPGKDLSGAVVSGVNQGQIVVTSTTGNSVTLDVNQYVITLTDGSQYRLNGVPVFISNDAAAVVESGVAAGSSVSASAAADGSLLVDFATAGALTAVIAVVVTSSSNNGGSTSTTAPTSTAAR